MKRKLTVVLVLITLALLGIIGLQFYWTFNAYRLNKNKFDENINIVMQRAMDDCKKDYFDSVRRVMVKRLSPPETIITIDTPHVSQPDSGFRPYTFSFKSNSHIIPEPYTTSKSRLNYYRSKINHPATIPELITEMSFYEPQLLERLKMTMMGVDLERNINPAMKKFDASTFKKTGLFALPPNVKQADSLRLANYYRQELNKSGIYTSFKLVLSDKPLTPQKPSDFYSETEPVNYKYHGFVFLNIVGPVYSVKATFHNPQSAILRTMGIPLLLSGLLVLFTVFCFGYIIRTILQQKKLSELKDDFINNMTHELKTPIATITVAIEGLQNFNALNDPEKTHRYLDTSRQQLQKLSDLVSKVLNAATYEQKGIELIRERVDVNEMVKQVISSEELKSGKKVTFEYLNNGLQHLTVDPFHFKNILINLVDNAVKYAVEPVVVKISCSINNGQAVFSIKDNGIGIATAHIDHIFEKFYRVPTGNVHAVKGTGLGLSYVKTAVEAHGGTISVKSSVSEGSEFIVSIPLN